MLCDKKNCTGCFACYNVCPKNAITMIEDECGYIYPNIDMEKCINCKLCEKSCPAINKVEFKYPKKCYAIRVKDPNILKKSTSGGIATILSKKIIENNGVVYGASYVGKCQVNHIRFDNIDDLKRLQGSKYVHSYIKDSYNNVKEDLINNKRVLFIGTPCQIAGLKRFLNREYVNLYLIDLICHGVPSQKFLKDEVKRLNNNDINVNRVNFRDKQFNNFTFSINKNNKTIYSQEWIKNPYFYTFMRSITYRENCYSCIYAKPERCSDITIGDFWGLGKDSKFYKNKEKGVSVILPITNKGIKLIESVKNDIEIEERQVIEAINGNDQLRKHVTKNKKVDKFKKIYKENSDFFKTYKKVCRGNLYKQKIKENIIVKRVLEIRREVKNGKK